MRYRNRVYFHILHNVLKRKVSRFYRIFPYFLIFLSLFGVDLSLIRVNHSWIVFIRLISVHRSLLACALVWILYSTLHKTKGLYWIVLKVFLNVFLINFTVLVMYTIVRILTFIRRSRLISTKLRYFTNLRYV